MLLHYLSHGISLANYPNKPLVLAHPQRSRKAKEAIKPYIVPFLLPTFIVVHADYDSASSYILEKFLEQHNIKWNEN